MVFARSFTDSEPFDNLRDTARASPAQMRDGVKLAIGRERRRLNKELQARVPLPVHPFLWSRNAAANRRAQRWWFAAVRRGLVPTANGRYQRTGLLQRSWALESRIEAYFGAISLANTRPGAEYVVGVRQVPSHERSGHPRIDRLAAKSSERLTNEVVALWEEISLPIPRN